MDARTRWGVLAWGLRPAYLVVELLVAAVAAAESGYSLRDDTVSDLGALTCTSASCSPGHAAMNAAFIGFGLLLAVGALLLAPHVGRLAAVLLVVAGLSSAAVGLTPLDTQPGWHVVAAAPLFVAQPVALLVLGRRLRGRLGAAVVATGVVTAIGAVGFVVVGDGAGAGALERVALWPVLLAPAVVAAALLRPAALSSPARAA